MPGIDCRLIQAVTIEAEISIGRQLLRLVGYPNLKGAEPDQTARRDKAAPSAGIGKYIGVIVVAGNEIDIIYRHAFQLRQITFELFLITADKVRVVF